MSQKNVEIEFSETNTTRLINEVQLERFPFELTLIGISLFGIGLLLIFSILFSLIGIMLVFAGIKLLKAAKRFREAEEQSSIQEFVSGFNQLRGYFRVFFWFIVITTVLIGYVFYQLYLHFWPVFEMLKQSPMFS
jgi:uncharacterized membrane protein HdeD (DUF308 family)